MNVNESYGQRPEIGDDSDKLAEWKKKGAPKEDTPAAPADSATKEDNPATPVSTASKEVKPAVRARAKRSSQKAKPGRPATKGDQEQVRINFLIPKTLHRRFRRLCFDQETTITEALRQYIVDSVGDRKGRK